MIVRARRALTLVIVVGIIVGATMLRPLADRNATILRPLAGPVEVARRGRR